MRARGDRGADDASVASMLSRLERLPPQREALKRALAQFGEPLDGEGWERSFISSDPDDVNRVVTVTGGFGQLVNHLVEIVRTAHAAAGLDAPTKNRHAETYIRAVRDDGGLTSGQADALIAMHRLRNRLQHASPDVGADEVAHQAGALLNLLPRVRPKLVAWLAQRGVDLGLPGA